MIISEFKKILFSSFVGTNWKITEFWEPKVTPNFYAAKLENGDSSVVILCSDEGDWALADGYEPSRSDLKFVDQAFVAEKLRETYGVLVMDAGTLDSPFKNSSRLCQYDVKHWKPRTVGESLFNWWD
ncbi:hypothetical protein [Vibrio sp. HN007]|uniref:hypothetical protein n=1 Tax=Vibrio iocasae TaxID=3098914 RepID=UPI0035D4BBEB